MKKGTILQVVRKDKSWWKVKADEKAGYVPANYIQVCDPPESAFTTETVEEEETYFEEEVK